MKISKLIEVLAQYLQEQKDMDILVEKYDGITDDTTREDLEELDINIDGKVLVINGIYNLKDNK